MIQNKKIINAYYLKKVINSNLKPLTDSTLLCGIVRYFDELFGIDVKPMLCSLPDDLPDAERVSILRDILNGAQEPSFENISESALNQIKDIYNKVKIPDITDYNFDKNLSFIFDAFDLSQPSRELLLCFMALQKNPLLRDILDNYDITLTREYISEDNIPFFEAMCDISEDEIKKLLSPNSIFFESNILVQRFGITRFTEHFNNLLTQTFNNADEVRNVLLGETNHCQLSAENFMHVSSEFNNIKNLLEHSKNEKGINILLYGQVGAGKTSFAHSVVNAAGLKLYSISSEEGSRTPKERRNRFCQTLKLLNSKPDSVILFDNADDILCSDRFGSESSDKLFVYNLLETNDKPVIWIVNSVRHIIPSFIRRFALTVKIKSPDANSKKTLWQGIFKKHNLEFDYEKFADLINDTNVPVGVLDTAVKNAKLTGDMNMVQYTIHSLDSAVRGDVSVEPTPVKKAFNTNLLNTDTDLKLLADRIVTKKLNKFSLCLYGAPGTGKTAFADYLGDRLNIPVIKKRASDLKGAYVGETEKNIAAAFAEAKSKKAMLVFDEADSFLQDRNKAQRSWEISSVNEMLTQMESAEFPFICTTNLMDTLDAASLRRFTFKVKYDYLTLPQVVLAFDEFFGIKVSESDVNKCTCLAPGDFVVVKNKADILDIHETKDLIDMLLQEQSVKCHNTQKIGF